MWLTLGEDNFLNRDRVIVELVDPAGVIRLGLGRPQYLKEADEDGVAIAGEKE